MHAVESLGCHLCPPTRLLTSAIFNLARHHHKQKEYLRSQLHLTTPAGTQDKNASCCSHLELDGKLKQSTTQKERKERCNSL